MDSTITKNQLKRRLEEAKGCQFVSIKYAKVQSVKKTGNFDFIQHPVLKITSAQVQFNYSYENSVNNRLKRNDLESDFSSSPLPWGRWEVVNKTIEHKGNFYVRFYLYKNGASESSYWYNGEMLTGDKLEYAKTFFTKSSHVSQKQSDSGLSEEDQCKPLTIQLDNIREITIDKITYTVI